MHSHAQTWSWRTTATGRLLSMTLAALAQKQAKKNITEYITKYYKICD
jgi:hypothetical protein